MTERLMQNRLVDVIMPLVDGLLPTDGIQYSSVATFGTTAVEVLNKLIDPGVNLALQKLELGLTQKFEDLNGSFAGSMTYYWEANSEALVPSGGSLFPYTSTKINLTGTFTKGVGTMLTSEDTFSGLVTVASLPYAPFRLILTAVALGASRVTGKVKNASYVRLVGHIIPGT